MDYADDILCLVYLPRVLAIQVIPLILARIVIVVRSSEVMTCPRFGR